MPKLASVGRQTILAAANLDGRKRQLLRSDVIAKDRQHFHRDVATLDRALNARVIKVVPGIADYR